MLGIGRKKNQLETYAQKLEAIMLAQQSDELHSSSPTATFPAQDEVQVRHNLMHPERTSDSEIISRDLRTSYLNKLDYVKAVKGGMYMSWLQSFSKTHKLQNDMSINALFVEVKDDCGIIENSSVSKDGSLLKLLLNPVKKFSIMPERAKGGFERKDDLR